MTNIASNTPTDHCLYSKFTCMAISWHISASDIGVVGGSGAYATVRCKDVELNTALTIRNL